MRSVGGGVQRAALPKRVGEDFWRGFVAGGEGPKRAMCERVVKSLGQQMKTCS